MSVIRPVPRKNCYPLKAHVEISEVEVLHALVMALGGVPALQITASGLKNTKFFYCMAWATIGSFRRVSHLDCQG